MITAKEGLSQASKIKEDELMKQADLLVEILRQSLKNQIQKNLAGYSNKLKNNNIQGRNQDPKIFEWISQATLSLIDIEKDKSKKSIIILVFVLFTI